MVLRGLAISILLAGPAAAAIDLAGKWSFELDPKDEGADEKWYARKLTRSIDLPGSLQERGFGNDVTAETKWTGAINDLAYWVLLLHVYVSLDIRTRTLRAE